MGHRLSKIYTRTGDEGQTGLGDGQRVAKDDLRVEAYGSVDELNSFIGLLLSEPELSPAVQTLLLTIQHRLFDLGGELSIPGMVLIEQSAIDSLEHALDDMNQHLNPLQEFILPGGGRAASLAHVARSICRRSERRLVSLQQQATINPLGIKYLNRLSDCLFVLARHLAKVSGHGDVLWQHERTKKT